MIMKKILFVTVFVSIVSFNNCYAQLLFKNELDKEIKYCIGYYHQSDTFSGWVTEGWYTLMPGALKVVVPGQLRSRYFYYYGFVNDSVRHTYQGSSGLLISDKPFKILDADKPEKQGKNKEELYLRNFRKIDTENKPRYTLLLKGYKNEEPIDSINNK